MIQEYFTEAQLEELKNLDNEVHYLLHPTLHRKTTIIPGDTVFGFCVVYNDIILGVHSHIFPLQASHLNQLRDHNLLSLTHHKGNISAEYLEQLRVRYGVPIETYTVDFRQIVLKHALRMLALDIIPDDLILELESITSLASLLGLDKRYTLAVGIGLFKGDHLESVHIPSDGDHTLLTRPILDQLFKAKVVWFGDPQPATYSQILSTTGLIERPILMHRAVHFTLYAGLLPCPPEMKRRILAARDAVLKPL
jgi:hypothetical protein